MPLPRFLHYLHAHLNGYFWLPCPLCGNKFGGHEKGGSFYSRDKPGEGQMTCVNCKERATALSMDAFQHWPEPDWDSTLNFMVKLP